MKRLKVLCDESGQAIVFSLLAMTILFGFLGFAVDVGVLLRAKRSMQTAADSAAIAGAAELSYGGATSAGVAAAAQNGVTIGTNGGSVTINTPPVYGAYAGQTGGYVEAIVSQDQPTGFMGMISHLTSMKVTARAVAYNGATATGCVFVCNPTASNAMHLQGSFDVSAPKCGVVVNSNSSTALSFTGGGGTLTAGSVGVVGGASGQTGDSTPAPVTGIAQQTCPLSGIAPPVPTGCTTPAGGNMGGTTTITPGCYSAPPGRNGAMGTLNITGVSGTPTFAPGTYVFEGNVNLSGTVTGTGITLEMYNGALSESTNTVLNLVAPVPSDNPTYNGIVILQPYSNTNTLLFDFGSSSGTIDGIIYAPNAPMELHDSGGDTSGGLNLITDLIVGTLYDQTATLSITSYSEGTTTSPLNRVALVE